MPATEFFGGFGRICVWLFFFLGGYGVYCAESGRPYDIIGRLKKLYVSYWKVFVIFVPIGFLFFSHQPAYVWDPGIYDCFSSFSEGEFIECLVGISAIYNREWWFVFSYAITLFTFPVIRAVIRNNKLHTNIILVMVFSILVTNVFPALGTLEAIGTLNSNYIYSTFFCQRIEAPCFWMGCVAAKEDLIGRLEQAMVKSKLLNPFCEIIIIGAIIYFRQRVTGYFMDPFYIPVLIVIALGLLKHLKYTRLVLLAIGKESTNMWLIHTFFCYYFLAVVKIVVAPQWAVPSLVVLVVLTYLASVAVTHFWKGISHLIRKTHELLKKVTIVKTAKEMLNK